MKRNREEEKIKGPMFPRLHVNDTEKGGPRAPPRNKMALYEHFTIPSHRYNSSVVPRKPNNDTATTSLVPSSSTGQGTRREQNTYLDLYRQPSTPVNDKNHAGALSLNNELGRAENKKKPLEEDDFMVPIFSQAGSETCIEKRSQNNTNGEGHPMLKQHIKDCVENSMKVSNSSTKSTDISIRRRNDIPWHVGTVHHVDVPDMQRKNPYNATTVDPLEGYRFKGDDETNKGTHRVEGAVYLEKERVDRGDGVSETSMVDSASEFDITPDDVVDVIGRKQFWKARSAIANQQRVLALQLFELHRLLKVQKLIAGSPNLLLETSALMAKSSLKDSALKKYTPECEMKDLSHKDMQKDVSPKLVDKTEGTAENAVPEAPSQPIPSHQHPIQPANTNMDPSNMNPWAAFHQPSSHQWLVPVMSPSEGLVYKPFPAPGFMGPLCGGGGPVSQTYGMPPPGIHLGGQSYCPPYGMPMMSPPTVSNLTVVQQQQPCNQSGQENVIGSLLREMQGSTASSRSDREPGTAEVVPEIEGSDKRVRVIRAVPHRSTRESAARIFQSIQQERQANESS